MSQPTTCHLCGQAIPPHCHFVVRIDVFADPTIPSMTTQELEATDFDQTFECLLAQIKMMSPDELQDDVHRRFEYVVCRTCQKSILANPLGRPETNRLGDN